MDDYSHFSLKQSHIFDLSGGISSPQQLLSPRSRTIEELLRKKYNSNPSISKDNSFSLTLNTPAANLEQVLAKSRFTKRSNNSAESSTPRFMPIEVQVSIKDLEKKISKEKNSKEDVFLASKKDLQTIKHFGKQSLELIQKLREEVRNRAGFLEPEEPPDLLEMNVLERNNYWLLAKKQKIEEQLKEKKNKELDGCTFKPVLNVSRLRTHGSIRSKSPNTSYTMQYAKKKNFRSNSTGKLSSRSTPKGNSREYSYAYNFSHQLSPSTNRVAYRSGCDMISLLNRAQPVLDYKYFK